MSRVSTQAIESNVPVRRRSFICKSIIVSYDCVGTWASSLLRASTSDLQSVTAWSTIGIVPVSSILVSEATILLGVNDSARVKALPCQSPSHRQRVCVGSKGRSRYSPLTSAEKVDNITNSSQLLSTAVSSTASPMIEPRIANPDESARLKAASETTNTFIHAVGMRA